MIFFWGEERFVPQIRDLHYSEVKETLFLVSNKLPVTCVTPGLNNFALSQLPSFIVSEVAVAG